MGASADEFDDFIGHFHRAERCIGVASGLGGDVMRAVARVKHTADGVFDAVGFFAERERLA